MVTGLTVAAALSVAAATITGVWASHAARSNTKDAYSNAMEEIQYTYGSYDEESYEYIVNRLEQQGLITEDERDRALAHRSDWFTPASVSRKDKDAINKVTKLIANSASNKTYDEVVNIINDSFGTTVAEPSYMTGRQPTEGLIEVEDPYWYTGKEMADLYGLKYDVDQYYDLIKQGTEAQVQQKEYENALANAAALSGTTVTQNEYLQSLDKTKEEAVINGSTLGARMANELLANTTSANNYSDAQQQVANNSIQNMSDALLNNANAKLTAKDYFSTLAQNIGNNIESLYWNDVQRRKAQLDYNDLIYQANQNYNAAVADANASMFADWAYANAIGNKNANDVQRYFTMFYNSNLNPGRTDQQRTNWAVSQMAAYNQGYMNSNNN